jgi:hypothetical protein
MNSMQSSELPVPFRIVNDEVELDREHARALVELLLPRIKQQMEEEPEARAG